MRFGHLQQWEGGVLRACTNDKIVLPKFPELPAKQSSKETPSPFPLRKIVGELSKNRHLGWVADKVHRGFDMGEKPEETDDLARTEKVTAGGTT